MRGTPTISTPEFIRILLEDARRYPPENLDHRWRMNTAFRLHQMLNPDLDEGSPADLFQIYLRPEERIA